MDAELPDILLAHPNSAAFTDEYLMYGTDV
jgi:hypothetical protein